MSDRRMSYLHRTVEAIGVNCKARGLDSPDGFRLWLEEKWGKELVHFNGSDLKRLNRNLGDLLTEFLGGKKRASD